MASAIVACKMAGISNLESKFDKIVVWRHQPSCKLAKVLQFSSKIENACSKIAWTCFLVETEVGNVHVI
jgi:hypothetical protein